MAVAVHLLDPALSAIPMLPAESETNESEAKEEPQGGQDTGVNVSQIHDNLWRGTLLGTHLPIGFLAFRTDDINGSFSRSNYSSS